MAVYAAMIDAMDQNIGRLLDTLEESGVADNTLVMFLSDNGGCSEEPGGRDPSQRRPGPADDYVAVGPAWGWAQNAPFRRYKSWVHEGGICTPLIARWPGHVPPGTIARQVGHIIDILPTCLELAGGAVPRGNTMITTSCPSKERAWCRYFTADARTARAAVLGMVRQQRHSPGTVEGGVGQAGRAMGTL